MIDIENKSILGVKISAVDMPTALTVIEGFIRERRPRMVVTADASAVVMAQSDRGLLDIINTADLVTPDSAGILWAARRFGMSMTERVSGADMVELICERAARDGHRVFLFGAAPGVADAAAEKLMERYPGLTIAGTQHGYFSPEESADIVRKIRESETDVLFVALGIPRQEKWIREHMEELQTPVAMGVGGTFDVISGRVKRAPGWMQRRGLEWVHRLASNPRKIGKVMTLPIFVLMVLRVGRSR